MDIEKKIEKVTKIKSDQRLKSSSPQQTMLESYVLTGSFKSSCCCNIFQHSIIITVDIENPTINARSTKLRLYIIDIGA